MSAQNSWVSANAHRMVGGVTRVYLTRQYWNGEYSSTPIRQCAGTGVGYCWTDSYWLGGDTMRWRACADIHWFGHMPGGYFRNGLRRGCPVTEACSESAE
jgi:hypothetical protein